MSTAASALAFAAALLAATAPSPAHAAKITVSCAAVGAEYASCRKHTAAWAAASGHTVEIFTQPNSSTDTLALLRQLFAARSPDLDVVNLDVVWPGIVARHLVDLRPYTRGAEREHYPALIANDTVDGRLVALPGFTDAGLLYYRRDLLARHGIAPPETWAAMAAAAQTIVAAERAAGNTGLLGYVFQGKAYEGLTCNALEWIASYGGGSIVDAGGRITVDNPAAAQALRTAAGWVGTIAPLGVLNYAEEDARGVFQSGRAVFMRNWPYAWSLAQAADSPVRGRVGVAPLPRGEAPGGRHTATLGGWHYGVSRYSRHPDVAADLVLYLTSRAVQKERAIAASFNPTRPDLYRDPEVLAANPHLAPLAEVLADALPRPSAVTRDTYPEVSQLFRDAVHEVLSGRRDAADALQRLQARLERARRGRW